MNVTGIVRGTLVLVIYLVAVVAIQPAWAADDDFTQFEFIRTVYDDSKGGTEELLLRELEAFIRAHPESEFQAEANFMLGRVRLDRGERDLALAQFMKTVYLYPESVRREEASQNAYEIAGGLPRYSGKVAWIDELLASDFRTGSFTDSYYNYLDFLHRLNIPRLYDRCLSEYYDFLNRYPDDFRREQLQRWIADTYRLQEAYAAAVAAYRKYIMLYPASELVPELNIRQAIILYQELGRYDDAEEILTGTINTWPGTHYAGSALYHRAVVYASGLERYDEAVADFDELTRNMPDHTRAIDGLYRMARLYADELRDPDNAVRVYELIMKRFPGDERIIEAMEESAKIYQERLQVYTMAASRFAQIATDFPGWKKSPQMLLRAAEICQKKTKDYREGIGYCRRVLNEYPDTEYANKAEKLMKKLGEKLGE